MGSVVIVLCIVVALLCGKLNSSNILVLEGVPSPSHHIWMRAIMIALTQQGHNITSLSGDIDDQPTPNLHYLHLDQVYDKFEEEEIDFIDLGRINPWTAQIIYNSITTDVCTASLESYGVKALLAYPDTFKFDIVMHDFIMSPCLLGVMSKFNYPPLIALTAFNGISTTVTVAGSQFFPYVPYPFRNEFTPTFLRRVENYLLFLFEYYLKILYLNRQYDEITWKHIPDTIRVTELEKRAKIVLVNTHPAIDIAEPTLPNIISVGGLQIQVPQNLTQDIKQIADNAKNGLILFSLGTNMCSDMLGDERVTYILEAFRSIPQYTFLWKFESDTTPVPVPKNVHIRAWIPQNEILAHPNTILFITHCGMLSTQEAVWYGVPMLGIPIFADQFLNNDRSVKAGISGYLDVEKLTDVYLRKEILKITQNKMYRENSKRLSMNFRDQPETPLARAIWWIERVIRNPDMEYLESPAKKMNLLSRHNVDVIAFLVIICLVFAYIWLKIMCKILKCLQKKTSKLKTN